MLCNEIEKLIGYEFRDKNLLQQALTHSSYAHDYLGDITAGNERLEFLGDAILDAVVGYRLFRTYPEKDEGYLTKLRAESVCERALGNAAIKMGLNRFLRLGKGEEAKEGRMRLSIVSDAVEALIAAVFLDGGTEAAAGVIDRLLAETFKLAEAGKINRDSKSELQYSFQSRHETAPVYRILEESGPDHAKLFTAGVFRGDECLGTGTGRTKKEAEMQAAEAALEKLAMDAPVHIASPCPSRTLKQPSTTCETH